MYTSTMDSFQYWWIASVRLLILDLEDSAICKVQSVEVLWTSKSKLRSKLELLLITLELHNFDQTLDFIWTLGKIKIFKTISVSNKQLIKPF